MNKGENFFTLQFDELRIPFLLLLGVVSNWPQKAENSKPWS
jgi:hypothetical protein